MLPRRSLVLLLMIALCSFPAWAGNYRWTIQGPDGGTVNQLAFDPNDSSIVYAATPNGVFRSLDGGQHWTTVKELLGRNSLDVVVASADPQKVFVASPYGLYKSDDRGVTWHLVHGFASFQVAASSNGAVVYSLSTGGLIRSHDGGVTFDNTGSDLPHDGITGIVVDPQNADIVYVSFFSTAGVYKSVDGGAHWTAANSGITASITYALAIGPSNGQILYVGGNRSLFKSINGGASWTPLATGLNSPVGYAVAVGSSTPNAVVAATNEGVITSTNGGASWSAPKLSPANAVAIDPNNAANILAVSSTTLFRSTDGGANYTPGQEGLTSFYALGITADPHSETTVYTIGPAGIFRSTDRGEHWTRLHASPTAVLTVDGVNSQMLYAITSGVVQRSIDGGNTWQIFNAGLPPSAGILLTADPHHEGTLYTSVAGVIYKKTAATPWTARTAGLPAGVFTSVVRVDPQNSAIVYAGGSAGLFKSIDGGENWNNISGELANASSVSIDPFDSNHLFTSASDAYYESTDGGTSWTEFTEIAPDGSLLFDASARGRMYHRTVNGDILRSADGGHTWISLDQADGIVAANFLVVGTGGKTLYAGGPSGAVWTYHLDRRRAAGH